MNETGNAYIIEKTLSKIIQQSNLSAGMIYFIFKDFTSQLKQLYNLQAEKELELERQKQKEENYLNSQD